VYDPEYAAIVRALDVAVEPQNRWEKPERVTAFTDGQVPTHYLKINFFNVKHDRVPSE